MDIREHGAAIDTALICLTIIARLHHLPADPKQLQHEFGSSEHAFEIRDLLRAAKWLGLKARAIQSDWTKLSTTHFPCIAVLAEDHLTGARDSAIASFKLKDIDLLAGCINQDAREVQTKYSKTFTTFFFPVGDEIRQIVVDWVVFLREKMLWGNEDPIFPATRIALGESRQFEAAGLERAHWSSAARIRTIFRDAFTNAGLPYFNPHCFRNTLVRLGQAVCQTPEEFKAWSQNLGHEKVLTTFLSYGEVENLRQGEFIHVHTILTGQQVIISFDESGIILPPLIPGVVVWRRRDAHSCSLR